MPLKFGSAMSTVGNPDAEGIATPPSLRAKTKPKNTVFRTPLTPLPPTTMLPTPATTPKKVGRPKKTTTPDEKDDDHTTKFYWSEALTASLISSREMHKKLFQGTKQTRPGFEAVLQTLVAQDSSLKEKLSVEKLKTKWKALRTSATNYKDLLRVSGRDFLEEMDPPPFYEEICRAIGVDDPSLTGPEIHLSSSRLSTRRRRTESQGDSPEHEDSEEGLKEADDGAPNGAKDTTRSEKNSSRRAAKQRKLEQDQVASDENNAHFQHLLEQSLREQQASNQHIASISQGFNALVQHLISGQPQATQMAPPSAPVPLPSQSHDLGTRIAPPHAPHVSPPSQSHALEDPFQFIHDLD